MSRNLGGGETDRSNGAGKHDDGLRARRRERQKYGEGGGGKRFKRDAQREEARRRKGKNDERRSEDVQSLIANSVARPAERETLAEGGQDDLKASNRAIGSFGALEPADGMDRLVDLGSLGGMPVVDTLTV